MATHNDRAFSDGNAHTLHHATIIYPPWPRESGRIL